MTRLLEHLNYDETVPKGVWIETTIRSRVEEGGTVFDQMRVQPVMRTPA